jgi:hypothetical protein
MRYSIIFDGLYDIVGPQGRYNLGIVRRVGVFYKSNAEMSVKER